MRASIGLGLILLVAAPAWAATDETVASRVFATASPSVVVMDASDANGKVIALGSGVVIAKGVVVSNCHVFEDRHTDTASAVYRGQRFSATLRYADVEHDLCSFTVNNLTAPPIAMRQTADLKVGEDVYAIGAPEGYDLTLSSGIVSSLRKISDGTVIQTTAPISPGSSGGGLFDSEGRLIGITSYYAKEGQQINFALPVEWVRALPQHGRTPEELAHESANAHGNFQEGVRAELAGDYASALAIYRPLAERGDERAQYNLASMYAQGQGVVQSDIEAMYWDSKAAKQGYAIAQYILGWAYQHGQGVPQDYAQAVYWYQEAAKQGEADAQNYLGSMYATGEGVPTDYATSAYWRLKAANQGNTVSQAALGSLYFAGVGVPQDYVQSAKWWILAQAGGEKSAMTLLPLAEKKMTASQIAEAQRLAREWWTTHHEQTAGQDPTTDVSPAPATPQRPTDPHDVQGWQQFLTSVVQNNMGAITTSPYLYFVPSAADPADVAALAKVQANLNKVVAATVLPGNMVAIGGPSSRTTATVLETAFRRAFPNSFKGVVILFIGNEADRAAVARAVNPSGATFRFAQM